jgi:hypothetical protein
VALEGSIFDRPLSSDTGKFAHSIFLDVTLLLWLEDQKEERRFVCTGVKGFALVDFELLKI